MAIIDSNQLPNLDIFGVFICHFTLTAWGMLGLRKFMTYMFYNSILLISILWGLKDLQSEIPLILSIRINAINIILDLIVLIFYFPGNWWPSLFSIVGAVIHLLMRFITISIMSKFCVERSGGTTDGLTPYLVPIFGNNEFVRRDPYEDIDSPHQSYPRTEPVVFPGTHAYTPKNPPPYQS